MQGFGSKTFLESNHFESRETGGSKTLRYSFEMRRKKGIRSCPIANFITRYVQRSCSHKVELEKLLTGFINVNMMAS